MLLPLKNYDHGSCKKEFFEGNALFTVMIIETKHKEERKRTKTQTRQK